MIDRINSQLRWKVILSIAAVIFAVLTVVLLLMVSEAWLSRRGVA